MVKSYQAKLRDPAQDKYPDAADIMSRSFTVLSQDTDIFTAMDVLLTHQISGACVVDEDGKLIGFISEKDCLKIITEAAYHENRAGGAVSNYMSTNVVTIDVSDGLNQIAGLFIANPFRKIPVLNQGRLVGVVRRRDALRAILDHEKKQNHSYEKHY
ncbi:MAG: CBS domain-containing protein [Acidobacteria bacterium]|nr:CBS domain-containing protein [Acidobacteriota bacterium]